MIPGVQPKIGLRQTEDGRLVADTEFAKLFDEETEFNWRLVRERDGLTKESKEVIWVEWNEDGTFKSKHDEPLIDRSLLMSPFNQFFTWQTTTITEIVDQRDDYIKFKTGNSTYELFKNNGKET